MQKNAVNSLCVTFLKRQYKMKNEDNVLDFFSWESQ
jgi:hypothetical protein